MKIATAAILPITALVSLAQFDSAHANLRATNSVSAASLSFDEAVVGHSKYLGRVLEDGACLCDEPTEVVTTVRMLTPGGKGHHFDFFTDRWRRRIDAYYNKTGVMVELIPLGSLEELNAEMFADAGKAVYDGYGFLPGIVGELSELGGLADLTEFVAGSQDVDWLDVLPFERDLLAVYGGKVRSIPCDGDVHSLHYRKDLFDQYNLAPPRTWDEYTERAKFFHGMEVDNGFGNGTVKLSGSCIERSDRCEQVSQQLLLQVHAATVQTQGTSQGFLFDSKTFTPNLGEAFVETLRHLENHAKYGDKNELADGECLNTPIDRMNDGSCAMTYYWGDVYSRHLLEGSVLDGKLGSAPTPGVTKVLDPNGSGKLVDCTEEICPYGKTYPDIGRVNLAPYAAGGGWSAGVAGGLSKEREQAMAGFLGFVCGREESLNDVITEARGTLATGADPFRKSHFDIERWVARGYPRDASIQYINTVSEALSSPNAVLDARFPSGIALMDAVVKTTYPHLVRSKSEVITEKDRFALAADIEAQWVKIIEDFDKKSLSSGGLPLKSIYQKSLNVYVEPIDDGKTLSIGAIVGIVLGITSFIIFVSALLVFYFRLKMLEEKKRIEEEMRAKRRQKREDDNSDSEDEEDTVDQRDEIAEIEKLSQSVTRKIIIWRSLFAVVSLANVFTFFVMIYPIFRGKDAPFSLSGATATLVSLFLAGACCFLIYDRYVHQRTRLIMSNAAKANAIVTNMFPGQFRDQMIVSQENDKNTSKRSLSQQMEHFMDNGENPHGAKPLADLFLETTVLFADIVGFTPWSSAREPSQVFTLLESVYYAFDELAVRRRIFKVETVGDCYVAVTGVPNPREDHALAMARFACEIVKEMSKLVKSLEVTLGPDTTDLTVRIGMHSGPVIGGVLRGARARFQLFGDTMNTTARIESTGAPKKIHVSAECAALIAGKGKGDWLVKRETLVTAKGKGPIQTYWLDPKRLGTVRSGESSAASSLGPMDDADGDVSESKQKRLISWNADQLVSLLKQVVARRSAELAASDCQVIPAGTYKISDGASLIDDVKEIVHLPEYDGKVVSLQQNPDDVVIPQNVLDQLHGYVASVCALYRNNAFHNFAHASAVTMSVLKLLSRIVAPSGDKFASGDAAASLHDHTYGITSDPLTQFACAFSALIHDADHYGIPNAQLVKEQEPIALLYGNRSVAEQNSLVLCWDMLMNDEYKEFREMLCSTQSELDRFRSLVVNSVLATDIVDKDLKNLRNARWAKAFESESIMTEPKCDATNRKATIVIEHIIQASDVSHTMQHWHIYRKWNERLFRECYACFQAGRAETDPSINWYKGELGFFDYYIIPLAKKLKDCGVFGKSSDEFLNYAVSNRAEWEAKGREVVAEMLETVEKESAEHEVVECSLVDI